MFPLIIIFIYLLAGAILIYDKLDGPVINRRKHKRMRMAKNTKSLGLQETASIKYDELRVGYY